MKTVQLLFISFMMMFPGCQSQNPQDVGDISFDVQKDDPNFELCNEEIIKQYYIRNSKDTAPSYEGEKRGLENEIFGKYSFPNEPDQNGYITIRFIVNCNGETGRFRMEEMDNRYQPINFDTELSTQILDIVKSLRKWSPRSRGELKYDYYQYLTFKIESGQIVKLLP